MEVDWFERDAQAEFAAIGGEKALKELTESARLAQEAMDETVRLAGGKEAFQRHLDAMARHAAELHLGGHYDKGASERPAFVEDFTGTLALFGPQAGSPFALERAELVARSELPREMRKPVGSYDPANSAAVEAYHDNLVGELEVEFGESRNPLLAWEGFRISKKSGQAIPGWILDYLDGCALRLSEILAEVDRGKPTGKEAQRVSRAFGFTAKRGRGSWFSNLTSARRDRKIYKAVLEETSRGTKLYVAQDDVARRMKLSASTVRFAYDRVVLLSQAPVSQASTVANSAISDG